jgi:hypothetical protein
MTPNLACLLNPAKQTVSAGTSDINDAIVNVV